MTARTYHLFWAIVQANWTPDEIRTLTIDARNRWLILGALGVLDEREKQARRDSDDGWRV